MPKKLPAKKTDISSTPKKPVRKAPVKKKPEPDISSYTVENDKETIDISDTDGYVVHTDKEKVSIGTPKPRVATSTNSLERLLNIKWSKYIPHKPTPKQYAALMLQNCKELLYGGALGGGKSDFLAYEALRFCDMPDFTSIIFRKQLTDLKQPKSLIPRVAQWLEPFRAAGDCKYVAADHRWDFKTVYPGTDIPGPPAMLQWGYIGDAGIRDRYQSAEYQLVCFDELGQWATPVDWLFMCSRIRATVCPIHGKDANNDPIWDDDCHICQCKKLIPLRRRAAMNPGPAWVKKRWRIVPDPSRYKTRQAALIAIQEGEKINWVGTHPIRRFIPAYLSDNPHLSEKDYREMLSEMTDDERSRLEDGNWEARKNARFKRKWVNGQYINLYDHGYSFLDVEMRESIILPYSTLKTIFVTVDSAATAKLYAADDEEANAADGKSSQKPSSTCIGVWGVTFQEQLLCLDFHKFRKELPDIVETLMTVNAKWRPRFNKIECNGLGIGVAQYSELAGLPVQKNIRKKDKLENSLAAQMMMKNGQIFIAANTPWAEEFEDDIFNWTGDPDEEDDTVDVLCDAALEITPRQAPRLALQQRRVVMPSAVGMTRQGTGIIPRYGL
jgi:phage terminase large subunit-like protein